MSVKGSLQWCVITCSVSSDAILLLLILHYNGSLRMGLIYAFLYPSRFSQWWKWKLWGGINESWALIYCVQVCRRLEAPHSEEVDHRSGYGNKSGTNEPWSAECVDGQIKKVDVSPCSNVMEMFKWKLPRAPSFNQVFDLNGLANEEKNTSP